MRPLPHLNGIRAFEAAARHGSIAGAAAELNVSAAAISRMVRLLEKRLGVSLFERHANRLSLTDSGRRYQVGLGPILDALSLLTEQVKSHPRARPLTVGVGPTFAVRWLIPRLADFRRVAPHVDVHVTTGGAAAPFSDAWTCGIKLGDGQWPGLGSFPLFDADLTPVCAPALARRLGPLPDIDPGTLLRVAHAPDDWPTWLAAAGLRKTAARGPVFEFYGQAQQAAADGLGIALGIRPYIDDDLAAGRLAQPFVLTVPKGLKWHLIFRIARESEPAFSAFRDWLLEAARSSARPPDGAPSKQPELKVR